MYNIVLHDIAEELLREIIKTDKESFKKLSLALDEIEEKGIDSSNTRRLANTDKIFRKRVGRWRVLFTMEKRIIHIWIIAIEKDTRKDYKKWIKYVTYRI